VQESRVREIRTHGSTGRGLGLRSHGEA